MADAYWHYGDNRQLAAASAASAASAALPVAVAKRPRTDLDAHSGHDLSNYHPLEDGRVAHRVIRDNDPIGASYDNYLRTQMSLYGRNESARPSDGGMTGHHVDDPRAAIEQKMSVYNRIESARPSNGGMTGYPVDDPRVIGITGHPVDGPSIMGIGGPDPALLKAQGMGVASGRSELRLPPDASSTLFVEGLPANCTRREVAHIFRPFVGYKEVRLVNKGSRHPGGDPLVLCFVDFISPAHAATAMDALEGYKFDEDDRDSLRLRLQFARHPGARSGGGHRGKR